MTNTADAKATAKSFQDEVIKPIIDAAASKPFRQAKYSEAATVGARTVLGYLIVRRLARTATTRRGRIGFRIYQGTIAVVGVVSLSVVDKVIEERQRRLNQYLTEGQRQSLVTGQEPAF